MLSVAEVAARLQANGQCMLDTFEIKLYKPHPTWRLHARCLETKWTESIEFRPFGNEFAIKLDQLLKSILREMGRRALLVKWNKLSMEHLRSSERVERLIKETDIDVMDYIDKSLSFEDLEKCIKWIHENTVELRLSTSFTSTDTTGTPDTT